MKVWLHYLGCLHFMQTTLTPLLFLGRFKGLGVEHKVSSQRCMFSPQPVMSFDEFLEHLLMNASLLRCDVLTLNGDCLPYLFSG